MPDWTNSVPPYTGASGKRLRFGGAVEQQFRSEMCESLTSMLLSCELAMSVPGVRGPTVQKIRAVDDLAREISLRLGANWRFLHWLHPPAPRKLR